MESAQRKTTATRRSCYSLHMWSQHLLQKLRLSFLLHPTQPASSFPVPLLFSSPLLAPSVLIFSHEQLLISSPRQCHSWSSPTSNSVAYLSTQVPQRPAIPVTSLAPWESWVSAADRWWGWNGVGGQGGWYRDRGGVRKMMTMSGSTWKPEGDLVLQKWVKIKQLIIFCEYVFKTAPVTCHGRSSGHNFCVAKNRTALREWK